MADDRSSGLGEGIRTGIGILNAFKEAIEETLDEAISRGDLSPERAKGVMKHAAEKVQTTLGEARERLDLSSRKEIEALRSEIAELRGRIAALESRSDGGTADAPPAGAGIPVD